LNADDADDADFFWNADDADDADFFWNADDADDADFFGTRMTRMTRILKNCLRQFCGKKV
jgi:hypothetical protein